MNHNFARAAASIRIYTETLIQSKSVFAPISLAVFLGIALAGAYTAAGAPSFDCSDARTPVERSICSSAELSDLDNEIARSYATVLAASGPAARDELLRSQRAWLSRRNRCGDDSGCLAKSMRNRLAELTRAVSSGDAGSPARLTHDHILFAQRFLAREGFYSGRIDGDFGPASRRALDGYRRSIGLPTGSPLTVDDIARMRGNRPAVADGPSRNPTEETAQTAVRPYRPANALDETVRPKVGAKDGLIGVPDFPLAYAYAPDLFEDDFLLDLAAKQIRDDQRNWQFNRGSQAMFTREQVMNRAPQFAARDLIGEFKQRLASLSSAVPSKFHVVTNADVDKFTYSGGSLIRKDSYLAQNNILFRPSRLISDLYKTDYPPLGASDVLQDPKLLMAGPGPDFPDEIASARTGHKGVHLVLDRRPVIAPLKMDARAAEALFLPYSCGNIQQWLDQGLSGAEAVKKQDACRRQPFFPDMLAVYDVTVTRIELKEDTLFAFASLDGARLYGPRGSLLKRYEAEDFAPAEDLWQIEADEEAASARAEEERREAEEAALRAEEEKKRKAEAERMAAMQEGLAGADIVGLRLGMTLDEADKIIRAHMDVGWVVEPIEVDLKEPFAQYRAYFRADRDEAIALFVHPSVTPEVQAITRSLRLPADTEHEKIFQSLQEKYGAPALEDKLGGAPHIVWTTSIDPNAPYPPLEWIGKPCRVYPDRYIGIIEQRFTNSGYVANHTFLLGDEEAGHEQPRLGAPRIWAEEDDVDEWHSCEPTIAASFHSQGNSDDSERPILTYALTDLSRYREPFLTAQPQAGYVAPKL